MVTTRMKQRNILLRYRLELGLIQFSNKQHIDRYMSVKVWGDIAKSSKICLVFFVGCFNFELFSTYSINDAT